MDVGQLRKTSSKFRVNEREREKRLELQMTL